MKILLIVSAVVLFLLWRYKKVKGKPVLKIMVSSSDGYTYNVTSKKVIEQMLPIEHVRHFLHYTTKFLHILSARQEDERQAILHFISEVASLDKINEESIRQIINIELNDRLHGDKTFTSTLYFQNVRNRFLDFSFPTRHYLNQFEGSLKAVMLYNSQNLDESHLVTLLEGIRYLNNAYESGINPKDLDSMGNLPNEAFMNRERIISDISSL